MGGSPKTFKFNTPIGNFDGIDADGNAFGWSQDPDLPNQPNTVHFYLNAPAGSTGAEYIGQTIANIQRSDVGNHSFSFSIPPQYRDGQDHLIYAHGIDLTGDQNKPLGGNPKTFQLPPILESVVFESINNETIDNELTDSEVETIAGANGQTSQRIFPDKKQPDEQNISRKRVRVKATLGLPKQGIQVYFKNFDVDDPSANVYIDENGNAGNDNRDGRIIDQPYPPSAAGIFSSSSPCAPITNGVKCPTNANGEAIAYFTVTKQPGDNFVIAASTDESYLTGVGINGIGLKDSSNNPLPTMKGKRTDLLTVWRKLHMEIGSMGEVVDNFVTGYVRGKGKYIGSQPEWVEINTSIKVEQGAYQETLAADQSRLSYGGRMDIAGSHSLQILDNRTIPEAQGIEPATWQEFKVQSLAGFVYLRPNHPIKIFDDDDFNNSDDSQKDGDNGEDVDRLSDTLSRMQDSDDISENAYASAYIQPEYQWANGRGFNNSNVDFVLYSPCTLPHCEEQRGKINQNRGSQALERDDFWIAYLLVSYQGNITSDVDPTGYLLGIAPSSNNDVRLNVDVYDPVSGVPPGGIGASIFVEAMRDYQLKPPPPSLPLEELITFARIRTAPHEVGHQFGLWHGGGLMGYSSEPLNFIADHINMMRWRIKSPGEGE